MDLLIRKKRALYRSIYRGCKETDILLGRFARNDIDNMNENDLSLYEEILNMGENDIYNYLIEKDKIKEEKYVKMIEKIKNFHNNSHSS